MYVFELLEQQPINTTLTTLHATDDTGIEFYSIVDGNTFFSINAVSGTFCIFHKSMIHLITLLQLQDKYVLVQ